MGNTATRDVIIRLRGELDPSLRSVFRDVEKMATAAHKERVASAKNTQAAEDKARKESARADEKEIKDSIKRAKDREKAIEQSYKAHTRAAEQAARAQASAARDMARADERARKESARADERETKESVKRAKDREKAIEQSYKAQTRAAEQAAKAQASAEDKAHKESVRSAEQAAKAQASAARTAAREQSAILSKQETAYRKVASSQQQLAEATKMTMSGLMSLGRGFAMIGLVGEKDTKKLLEGLIKIQAAFDLLRGGIDVVMGLTRAYRAYQAAVTAAAAAQATLTAAQAVGGAAAAGGAGAGIGKALGAGAVGGLAAKGIGAVAGLGTAGLTAGAGAVVGGGSAILSAGLTAREAFTHGIGKGATPGSAVDTVGSAWWNPFARILQNENWTGTKGNSPTAQLAASQEALSQQASAQSNRARIDALDQSNFGVDVARQQMGIDQSNEAFARGPRDLSAYTNRRQSAQKGMADASKAAAEMRATNPNVSTDQIELSARKQLIDTYQDEANKVRELNREKIQGHKQILSDLTAEATARRQMVKQLEDEKKSAEERFGSLDAGKQQRLLELGRRFKAGQDIGTAGEAEMEQFVPAKSKMAEELSKRRRARTGTTSFEPIYGTEHNALADEQRKGITTIRAQIKDTRTIIGKLEWDDANLERELEKQLVPLFKKQWEDTKQMNKETIDRSFAKAMLEINSGPAQ